MKHKSVRILSAALAAVMLLAAVPAAALADDSTTVVDHIYKDMTPNTQIYALTETPGASYKNYGSMYEPDGGVIYGRTTRAGDVPQELRDEYRNKYGIGDYGILNFLENQEESIIGYYTYLSDAYPVSYWSYLYKHCLVNGKHSLLIYMNFDKHDEDCKKVIAGEYDEKLKTDFEYLESLGIPVFMRVGGEMDTWSKDPELFKQAYQHIGHLRDQYGPSVALVFSPNYNPGYKQDMDRFYPGDKYVDWVGVSLYFNRIRFDEFGNKYTGASKEMFYGIGDVYGDPVLNVQTAANLAKLHNKPMMITEGGSATSIKNEAIDNEWVAERISREISLLPMLYPQIKAIVMTDYGKASGEDYTFYNNSTITSALRNAVSALGVYMSDASVSTGKYLTPLSDLPDLAAGTSGDVKLFGYTYAPGKLTATLYIDDKAVGTASDYPYAFTVSRSALLTGEHSIRVEFDNNQKIGYKVVDGKVTALDEGAKAEEPASWAKDEVYRAIAMGVLPTELQKGYANYITRRQFAAMAVKTYETLTGTTIEGRVTFNDTDDVDVQKLAYLGVVGGKGNGIFAPDDLIQRQEAAKIFSELAKVLGRPLRDEGETPVFADMEDVAPWAVEYLGQVAREAIMMGDTDDGRGHIRPLDHLSVQESIIMLTRLIGKLSLTQ